MTTDTAPRLGRPRSEDARLAVLHAVDDLLVEVGYAAMTMKGIAERAGVGRQTVYRWWATKAEILLEACAHDTKKYLHTPPQTDPAADLLGYLRALTSYLVDDPAGIAYRALIGEAQHDRVVRQLLEEADILTPSARAVLARVRPGLGELAVAQLTGPVLVQVLIHPAPLTPEQLAAHVSGLLLAWGDLREEP